ncbi:hypothetical protein [Polaribacter cellanae]|uniref:Uncharacterized protein n=1 Tax=Polaribacter cellanae TaxID=2818493 RepID=A0A975H6F6_9FLAO|nr:hypothetical protein [Polaribacter cellanae]QTE22382.1 hypothetical protein J3359_16505 [Polaribacter cellanae]
MNTSINKSLSFFSKCLVLYLVLLLVEGKYRIDFLNNHFNSKYINIIKLSSNVNMIITSLFVIFIIILILIICYFVIEIFDFNISMNSVIQAFALITLIFTVFQFIRLFIDFTMLKLPISNLIDDNSFFAELKTTKWFHYITILDYLMILVGIFVLGLEIYIQEEKKNSFEIFCISGVFLICYSVIMI